jgi:beta-glucosidase
MKKNLFIIICGLLFSCKPAPNASDTELLIQKKAVEIIAQMTIDEKISQMVNATPGIERLNIKPYDWWSEALHGIARNGRATVFPEPIGLGATFDPEIVERMASAIADEARAKFEQAQKVGNYGIFAGLTFWSPNINIFRDPRWGRGQETYGEDPYLTARLGVAFVKGLQGNDPFFLKAAACAKHFAIHSGPEGLRHVFDVSPSKKDLFETYLPAFEALVKEGKVEAVMGAYNRVYGESASGSRYLLTEILRDRWGFKGHIVSDCGAIDDIYLHHKIAGNAAEASAIAVKSGLNVECGKTFEALKDAVEQGLLTEADIDKALLPLMMTRLKLGILTPDDESPYRNIPEAVIASDAHASIAREAAQKSMVLLKNDHTLPLKKDIRSIYITGPQATDTYVLMGNYYGTSPRMITFLEGITSKVSNATIVNYRLGFLQGYESHIWTIGEIRLVSDVLIVVLGLTPAMEGEEGESIASSRNGDKTDLTIPAYQMEFLRAVSKNRKNKIVTVVTGGSPVELQEVAELSDAVVMAWYAGQEGGTALGDLLFGDASFSGRLPVTFPVDGAKLPAFEDYSMQGRTYKYQTENIMYPFGYGLTYGNVSYSGTEIINSGNEGKTPLEIKFVLSNQADREVEEVAQLYVSVPGAGIEHPVSSLIGFKRVKLQPNSSQEVKFTVQPELLETVVDDGTKTLLKGEYTFTISGAAPGKRSDELGVQKVIQQLRITNYELKNLNI